VTKGVARRRKDHAIDASDNQRCELHVRNSSRNDR
jgi:hypothetical protein